MPANLDEMFGQGFDEEEQTKAEQTNIFGGLGPLGGNAAGVEGVGQHQPDVDLTKDDAASPPKADDEADRPPKRKRAASKGKEKVGPAGEAVRAVPLNSHCPGWDFSVTSSVRDEGVAPALLLGSTLEADYDRLSLLPPDDLFSTMAQNLAEAGACFSIMSQWKDLIADERQKLSDELGRERKRRAELEGQLAAAQKERDSTHAEFERVSSELLATEEKLAEEKANKGKLVTAVLQSSVFFQVLREKLVTYGQRFASAGFSHAKEQGAKRVDADANGSTSLPTDRVKQLIADLKVDKASLTTAVSPILAAGVPLNGELIWTAFEADPTAYTPPQPEVQGTTSASKGAPSGTKPAGSKTSAKK